jgi:flagellar biogenesis protein FliO
MFLATAASAASAAAAATAPSAAQLPIAGLPDAGSVVPAALVLAALAIAALLLVRRRGGSGRLVRVIETASLGPRRSIVVARVGEELLVLGSSEAGIQLLSTRPAPAESAAVPAPAPALEESQAGLLARMGLSRKPTFEELLAESDGDLELRRKLAQGRAARVR